MENIIKNYTDEEILQIGTFFRYVIYENESGDEYITPDGEKYLINKKPNDTNIGTDISASFDISGYNDYSGISGYSGYSGTSGYYGFSGISGI